jgi:hypothetical protein
MRHALAPLLICEIRRGFIAWGFVVRQQRRREKAAFLIRFLTVRNTVLGLDRLGKHAVYVVCSIYIHYTYIYNIYNIYITHTSNTNIHITHTTHTKHTHTHTLHIHYTYTIHTLHVHYILISQEGVVQLETHYFYITTY